MQPHCPNCGLAILAADINLVTTLAKCQACNSVFNFAPLLEVEHRRPPSADLPRSIPQPSPLIRPTPARKFTTEQTGDKLTIVWRWFAAKHLFTAIFAIALSIIFPYWFVFLVSLMGVCYSLTGILNSTRITVTPQSLLIEHFPLPTRVNRRLLSPQIQQIYCRQRIVTQGESPSERGLCHYDLFAVLGDNSKVELIADFENPDEPRFLEQEIERHLNIPDRRVMGEYLN